jgi:hypothetical protein
MPLPDFTKLPPEHQRLLQLAKEQHSLDVVPLQEPKAGQTGAVLYLASVSLGDTRQVQHFVVKFDRVNERKSSETERHGLAVSDAMGKGTIPVLTKIQTPSTQRERDCLFGGHRRAFSPLQFKHDIPKLSA